MSHCITTTTTTGYVPLLKTKKMAKKIWKDHNGDVIPTAYVPSLDKARDRVAQRVLKQAVDLNVRMAKFKDESLMACDALFDKMLEDHKVRKNSKGGYSISSFGKDIKIEISIQERVEFDDLIQVAQLKINEYLESKTHGIDTDLQQIINLAFKTTQGKMDVKRVLGLFKLNIKHHLWVEAMDILKKSISRNNSKRYLRVWKKADNGEYKAVDLNFSSI